MKSIIHPKFEGTLVLISGLHGLGKTTLAATMENPALTGMIDFDLKGRALAQEIGMKFYTSPEHGSPDDYDVKALSEWFFRTLTKLPDGITHLIIDNATWAEAGLGWRVLQNPAKYGVNPKNAQAGIYGGVNPGITVLWSSIFTYLQNKGVRVVTVINHMSQPWINGAPAPNKFNVKGNKVFNQIASLALILTPASPTRGGKPPVPSALVIKEALSITRFNDGEFSTIKAIPARVPVCNWKRITGYFNEPANFATPAPGEEWSQDDVNSYSEWLSPEQVQWVLKVSSYSEDESTQAGSETSVKTVPAQPVKPAHWSDDPENRAKLEAALTKQGIPLQALFDTFNVTDWAEINGQAATGKEALEKVRAYWAKHVVKPMSDFELFCRDVYREIPFFASPEQVEEVMAEIGMNFDPTDRDALMGELAAIASKEADKAAG